MYAAFTALTDQAAAATQQSLDMLAVTAQRINGTFGLRAAGPITARMLAKFRVAAGGGKVGHCPHISLTAPQPAVWMPWAPGRVRCLPCAMRAVKRIDGTRELHTCDGCRRYTPKRITIMSAQLPAIVEVHDGRPLALPPIRIEFGLCSTCTERDNQES